jgi:hypothetical protein
MKRILQPVPSHRPHQQKSATSADGGVGDLLSKVAFIFEFGANGS